MSPEDKLNIVVDCVVGAEAARELGLPNDMGYRAFAWIMAGTDDAKMIFAIDEEGAARIAIRARMDHCEQSEDEAFETVALKDEIRPLDVADILFQGEAPLWDGARSVAAMIRGI